MNEPAAESFWCPSSIDRIHSFLRRAIPKDGTLEHDYAFVRNICYNLQYLEFLNHLMSEHNLHATVSIQTKKTFVISGMSIVEALLWYLLKKNKQHRADEWEEAHNLEPRTFSEAGNDYKVETKILRKLATPLESEMPLDAMIKRVESKKLLGLERQVYRDLNYLRKLRNRVHIHSVQHDKDTDWYSFSSKEVQLMKKVLHSVFSSEIFSPEEKHQEMLSYLVVQEDAETLADGIPA